MKIQLLIIATIISSASAHESIIKLKNDDPRLFVESEPYTVEHKNNVTTFLGCLEFAPRKKNARLLARYFVQYKIYKINDDNSGIEIQYINPATGLQDTNHLRKCVEYFICCYSQLQDQNVEFICKNDSLRKINALKETLPSHCNLRSFKIQGNNALPIQHYSASFSY